MHNKRLLYIQFLYILLMTACGTSPEFDTSGIDLDITPQHAADNTEILEGSQILWGGIIISSTNLKDETQIEVLAYPLASRYRPDIDLEPLGRFLAIQPGYLETRNFAQGRLITVSGVLQKNRIGRIGESEYTYPVINISQLQLWKTQRQSSEPSVHIGVGVMFHD